MGDTARGPRPDTPRIPPVSDPTPEQKELSDGAQVTAPDGSPLNIFSTLAHNPKVLHRFNQMGGTLLLGGSLPAREREIVILRVGWNCRSAYEFGQHTVIGHRAGLTDAEIAALAGGDLSGWPAEERALVDMADDLCSSDCVSEATWAALAGRWSEAELVELLVLAGFYRLVSGFLNSAGVALDPGVPGWPEGARP